GNVTADCRWRTCYACCDGGERGVCPDISVCHYDHGRLERIRGETCQGGECPGRFSMVFFRTLWTSVFISLYLPVVMSSGDPFLQVSPLSQRDALQKRFEQ